MDFMRTQGTRPPRDRERLWLLDPERDTLLYAIDSFDDIKALADEYPHRSNNPKNPTVHPDWQRVRDEGLFDAVHVTARAIESVKAQPPADQWRLFGWDVESTLWLRWRLTGPRCLGVVTASWQLVEKHS